MNEALRESRRWRWIADTKYSAVAPDQRARMAPSVAANIMGLTSPATVLQKCIYSVESKIYDHIPCFSLDAYHEHVTH